MSLHLDPDQGSYRAPSYEHATVSDAMRHGVLSCPPDAPAVEIARLMAMRHIHAVVIAGVQHDAAGGERLRWGVISDTDLLRAADRLEDLTAGDLATGEPVTVPPGMALREAVACMLETGATHVLVAEGGEPAGVLSTLDVAGTLAWGRA